jgi:magnesium-transporting ATPase (P-type)
MQSSPITAVQMMWVNLLQDTLASLSLATERPSDSLLKRRPYGRNQSLVSSIMFINITAHSAYQLVVLFALLFAGINDFHSVLI